MPLQSCKEEQYKDAVDTARTLLGGRARTKQRKAHDVKPDTEVYDNFVGPVVFARATYTFTTSKPKTLVSVTFERDMETLDTLTTKR